MVRVPNMDNPACAVCGKIVKRLPVHEDNRLFHLHCYIPYKRQAMPPTLPRPQPQSERRLPA